MQEFDYKKKCTQVGIWTYVNFWFKLKNNA
jgi:hypothetical protein